MLIDVRMPDTNGIELYRQVTAKSPHFSNRTVFMTGDFTNEDVIEAVHATGCPLLEKPFTADDLHAALRGDAPPEDGPHAVDAPPTRGKRAPAPLPARHDSSQAALDHILRAD